MNNIFYVYHLIDPANDLPFYVGKGSGCRIFDHVKNTQNKKLFSKNKYLFYKINKILRIYGDVKYKKIIENLDENTAFNKEVEEIKKYGRKNNKSGILCNMTDGGEGTSGHCVTDKMKKYLSEKRISFLNNNPDIRQELINRIDKYRLKGSQISANITSKYYTFVTPDNNIITIKNLNKFCKLNNLSNSKMWKLVNGQKNKYKNYKNINYFNGGMKRKSNANKIKLWHKNNKQEFSNKMKRLYDPTKHCKYYTFISPDGQSINIYNLTKFCNENNLSNGHMSAVNSGNRLHHKGWTRYNPKLKNNYEK